MSVSKMTVPGRCVSSSPEKNSLSNAGACSQGLGSWRNFHGFNKLVLQPLTGKEGFSRFRIEFTSN